MHVSASPACDERWKEGSPWRDNLRMALALRPSFALSIELPARKALAQLAAELSSGPMVLRRTRVPGGGRDDRPRDRDHLVLTVPAAQQHFWSPWLTIELTPRDGRAHLHARFSPHPSVWTAFVFAYLGLGTITAVALAIAGSGLLVRGVDLTWALWVAGGCAIGMGILWWISQIGQRIARDQMAALTAELERASEAIAPARAASGVA
jgi:hypothetical protein